MTHRFIETEYDRAQLVKLIGSQKLPFTVQVTKGRNRSADQNRLAFLWYKDIAEQLGDQTVDEVRAFCKLTIGVPILRAENEPFRGTYDKYLKPLPYEEKLEFIRVTDLPVTRLFKTKQMTAYLDTMQREFSAQGVILTDPEAKGLAA